MLIPSCVYDSHAQEFTVSTVVLDFRSCNNSDRKQKYMISANEFLENKPHVYNL